MSDGIVGRTFSPEKIKFLFLSINRVSVFTQDAPLNIQSKSLHGKPYFLFPDVLKRWSFQKKLRWNMIFLVLLGKMIFLFPENMILPLRRKMKDDLSQKIHGKMIVSSNVPKRWSF